VEWNFAKGLSQLKKFGEKKKKKEKNTTPRRKSGDRCLVVGGSIG